MAEERSRTGSWPMISHLVRGALLALGMAASAFIVVSCQSHPNVPTPAGQKCALGSPPSPAFPRLFRAVSQAPATARYPQSPICKLPHSVSDECEIVDDLEALLGTGYDCVNGADAPLAACEGWSSPSRSEDAQGDRPCGPSACPNVALSIRDPAGKPMKMTLYDDVSCHRGPREPACPKTARSCYYRVFHKEEG
jgi:hypothetical protein